MSEKISNLIQTVLKQNPLLQIEELSAKLSRDYGFNVKLSELIDALIALDKGGIIRKVRDEEFDPYKPLTTLKWQLTRPDVFPTEAPKPTQVLSVSRYHLLQPRFLLKCRLPICNHAWHCMHP